MHVIEADLWNLASNSLRISAVSGTEEPSSLHKICVHLEIILSGAPLENIISCCFREQRTLISLRSRENSKTEICIKKIAIRNSYILRQLKMKTKKTICIMCKFWQCLGASTYSDLKSLVNIENRRKKGRTFLNWCSQ